MKMSVGIGTSTIDDAYDAGTAASKAAKEQLEKIEPDFLFVFSTIGYEQQDVLEAVSQTFGDVPMSGATFEGIIGRGLANESMYAVQVVAIKSDDVYFQNFSCPTAVSDPREVGNKLGAQIAAHNDDRSRVLFLFPDFKTNITAFFEGIEDHTDIPFIGGMSGDNLNFKQGYQFHNGTIHEASCSAVIMAGDFDFKTIFTHGSEPIGKTRTVTKSVNNTIFEVDDQPALDFASQCFGEPITKDNLGAATAFVQCRRIP